MSTAGLSSYCDKLTSSLVPLMLAKHRLTSQDRGALRVSELQNNGSVYLGHVESGTGPLFHSWFLVLSHPMNAGLHCDLRSFAARAKTWACSSSYSWMVFAFWQGTLSCELLSYCWKWCCHDAMCWSAMIFKRVVCVKGASALISGSKASKQNAS